MLLRALPPSTGCNPLYHLFHSCQAVTAEQSAATAAAAAAQELLTHDVAVVVSELAHSHLTSALISVFLTPLQAAVAAEQSAATVGAAGASMTAAAAAAAVQEMLTQRYEALADLDADAAEGRARQILLGLGKICRLGKHA
jgi:hypothetical protein